VRDGRVDQVELNIYEPPRFFEALLRGRAYTEPPDITSRICGICPVAYQMSAVLALEDALGVAVPEPVRRLRRLLYCGEWLQSHALHVVLLHAPDFLGYPSGIAMAADHPQVVEDGLALKKAGNALIEAIGGRPVHPINVKVGGFHRAPARAALAPVAELLKRGREQALGLVRFAAALDVPDVDRPYLLLALRDPEGAYPIDRGSLASSAGLDAPVAAFGQHVAERQVAHSTALHAALDGERYLTGPLARFGLNADRLTPVARAAARDAGLVAPCTNPFRSIVVRCVEMLHACDEALELIAAYEPPDPPAAAAQPRAGTGHGATEAPRGVLYQRYELADDGTVRRAVIVPPTSQNQATIEADLADVAQRHLHLDDAALRDVCEQAIRNFDPCISCATHFLRLEVDRG
jgi:coenzyme F420-reducing hydrogenase alpha subunit